MNRKILAQGDKDGACFLYSIATAYVALTGKTITRSKWTSAIRASPFKMEDFLSGRGTEKLDDNTEYFEGLCRDFLSSISGDQFEVTSQWKLTRKSLCTTITKNQVAITAINNGNHWICITDFENEKFNIACSSKALDDILNYTENSSIEFKRTYNKSLTFPQLKLWQEYALLIKIPT
jgi:hypothetical protein